MEFLGSTLDQIPVSLLIVSSSFIHSFNSNQAPSLLQYASCLHPWSSCLDFAQLLLAGREGPGTGIHALDWHIDIILASGADFRFVDRRREKFSPTMGRTMRGSAQCRWCVCLPRS